MFDVVALGELLVDFTACGISENGMRLFEQNPGGAPANVLSVLSNFGKRTAFLGKVGKDMHGAFLKDTLLNKRIDISGLVLDENYYTTLAFVDIAANGERKFSFARKPGADTQLSMEDLDYKKLKNTRIFHFGSLSLTDEPSRSATLAAIQCARENGAIISYDPNYRALLWESKQAAIKQIRSVLQFVDIIKISDEETEILTGYENPEDAAAELVRQNISCVVVTLGAKGALLGTREFKTQMMPPDGVVVDTTGAGDAFCGGMLYKIMESNGLPKNLEQANDFLHFANCVATLCVQRRGAIPAMPSLEEVLELYQIK